MGNVKQVVNVHVNMGNPKRKRASRQRTSRMHNTANQNLSPQTTGSSLSRLPTCPYAQTRAATNAPLLINPNDIDYHTGPKRLDSITEDRIHSIEHHNNQHRLALSHLFGQVHSMTNMGGNTQTYAPQSYRAPPEIEEVHDIHDTSLDHLPKGISLSGEDTPNYLKSPPGASSAVGYATPAPAPKNGFGLFAHLTGFTGAGKSKPDAPSAEEVAAQIKKKGRLAGSKNRPLDQRQEEFLSKWSARRGRTRNEHQTAKLRETAKRLGIPIEDLEDK